MLDEGGGYHLSALPLGYQAFHHVHPAIQSRVLAADARVNRFGRRGRRRELALYPYNRTSRAICYYSI
jgi:hypothetical protein